MNILILKRKYRKYESENMNQRISKTQTPSHLHCRLFNSISLRNSLQQESAFFPSHSAWFHKDRTVFCELGECKQMGADCYKSPLVLRLLTDSLGNCHPHSWCLAGQAIILARRSSTFPILLSSKTWKKKKLFSAQLWHICICWQQQRKGSWSSACSPHHCDLGGKDFLQGSFSFPPLSIMKNHLRKLKFPRHKTEQFCLLEIDQYEYLSVKLLGSSTSISTDFLLAKNIKNFEDLLQKNHKPLSDYEFT